MDGDHGVWQFGMMSHVTCEWGLAGVEAWRSRATAFIIVDVLSFSTAVSVAVDRGAVIIPFPYGDPTEAAAEAVRRGAVAAAPKRALGGQVSLSPTSLRLLAPGTRVLLPSPNGSRLSLETGDVPTFCGTLRNITAVAKAARHVAKDGMIVVIAAGERWPDQSLRPAIEDWLGAGAIIRALAGHETPEAMLARLSFAAIEHDLSAVVRGCMSGGELIDRGFADDVDIALEVESSQSAPTLIDGAYRST